MRWLGHQSDEPRLSGAGTEAIQCVVIAGTLPDETHKRSSFETFRNACKDVMVLTFDELLQKLKYIRDELSPAQRPASTQASQSPASPAGVQPAAGA